MFWRRLAAWAVAVCACGVAVADENWPQFRGPTGLGYTAERNLPLTWGGPNAENVLWKSPLVGQGHASPIVWEDRVVVATAYWPPSVQRREEVIPEHHVRCYRAGDGQLLWDTQVPPGPWLRTDFRSGPGGGYACPTPATDGRRVYCVFGSSVIAALDFQGRIVWRKTIEPHTFDVTPGSSPIVYRDTVILLCAMAEPRDSRVVAFQADDGAVRWQTPLPAMRFGHSTPIIVRVKDREQMIFAASGGGATDDALQGLDPATGKRLWWCRGAGDASSPAFGAGIVYFDSGRGGPGTAVDPSGEGDVSQTHIRWTVGQMPESIGSPIVVGQHVYRLFGSGILKCWDAATGQQAGAARLSGLGSTWASPVADPNGRLYFATAGKSYVVQATPELKVLATNDLGDANHASPAVAHGRLFFVGTENVWCVGAK
jgi:outer membrane protein assembly factor BamB